MSSLFNLASATVGGGHQARSGGYRMQRSVRLRSSASAYFNRTPASATNRRTWTLSFWAKKNNPSIGANQHAVMGAGASTYDSIGFYSDSFQVFFNNGSSAELLTTQVFRDPSSWYHFVVAVDTTQATSSNRIKLYVNGSQITAFGTSTYPSQNYDTQFNTAEAHRIGTNTIATTRNFDGYLTEVNFIDGQALTPSSFGETNPYTGVWRPKRYTGTYGTNGFYLNFSDNSAATAAAIGKDYSGNGNDWTPNNISVTAGVTYDSMLDVPTPWADGGNGRGNYAVMSPVGASGGVTMSNGNLRASVAQKAAPRYIATSSIAFTGVVYAEVTVTPGGGPNPSPAIGIKNAAYKSSDGSGTTAGQFAYQFRDSSTPDILKDENGSSSTFVAGGSMSSGDVMMLAVDVPSGKMWLGKNGTWLASGNPAAGTSPGISGFDTTAAYWFICATNQGITTDNVFDWNFGQRPFSYTPPTGFKALNTQNLPDATIPNGSKNFDVSLYTGTGATQSITNSGAMQPDLVWVKGRSFAYSHLLFDSIRGAGYYLSSNLTNAEATLSGLTSFNTDGFSLGVNANANNSGTTYVGWQWKGGGAAVTNTAGSISSQVSANPTAGFSVVTYTGTGANATVGHGLGVAPKLVILKSRSVVIDWAVYHGSVAATNYLLLNSTAASAASAGVWNNTAPTSTVFSIGSSTTTNTNGGTYVAYCFSEVAGYSKFGTWTNNNSTDGAFIYLGFRPRFILLKNTDNVEGWFIWDSARQTYNMAPPSLNWLNPNLSNAEGTNNASTAEIDGLSNGFKIRTTNPAAGEISFGTRTYIYAAFAETPFKNSLAR
jgi:hypothetical protein